MQDALAKQQDPSGTHVCVAQAVSTPAKYPPISPQLAEDRSKHSPI